MATEVRETGGLIGSDKVDGTAVYGADRKKIGSIERVMIGKRDGKVSYAVLSFGGFLGIGDDHYPLPWNQLTYDTELGGYLVNLTKDRLQGAPKYSGSGWDWEDRTRARTVNDYYGAPWAAYWASFHEASFHEATPGCLIGGRACYRQLSRMRAPLLNCGDRGYLDH
jgi:hypothetical protein